MDTGVGKHQLLIESLPDAFAYHRMLFDEEGNPVDFEFLEVNKDGLHNRAYLEEEMQRLDTERQLPISIIMVDLNGLKLVNDVYGHKSGDVMLKSAEYLIPCRKTFRQKALKRKNIPCVWLVRPGR